MSARTNNADTIGGIALLIACAMVGFVLLSQAFTKYAPAWRASILRLTDWLAANAYALAIGFVICMIFVAFVGVVCMVNDELNARRYR
jgi:hypothetical protein